MATAPRCEAGEGGFGQRILDKRFLYEFDFTGAPINLRGFDLYFKAK